jgi:hypothetical protein
MFSKREAEGYLLVDHRDSPGISAEQAAAVAAHPFVEELPFLAQSVFWVDPVKGGLKRY